MALHSIPGFGEFLLSHSHAVYYSPNQWCSVGYVIHNVRFPNLKQISYGVMRMGLRFNYVSLTPTQSDRLGPSP